MSNPQASPHYSLEAPTTGPEEGPHIMPRTAPVDELDLDDLDLDAPDFETQDLRDAQELQDFRTLSTGYPARPGTLR